MFEDLQRVRRWLTYFDEFFRTVYLDGGVGIGKDIIDLVNTRSFHSVDIVGHAPSTFCCSYWRMMSID